MHNRCIDLVATAFFLGCGLVPVAREQALRGAYYPLEKPSGSSHLPRG